MKTAKLTLIGAGPGGADLITIRGLRALQKANVVLYDALADPELLAEAPATAKKIYVGKRAGNHKFSQDQINLLIVHLAKKFGHVVRLKGGDPFVFGRGQEELQFAKSYGIEVAIIPGISSALSVPALQEVPLTHRGINQSFWVVTGTTSEGALSADLMLAAQSSATVVILMGMKKLSKIMDLFQNLDKANTPVMIVQNGSRENEKYVLGTVLDIEAKVMNARLSNPAIILVGEVVTLHQQWSKEKDQLFPVQQFINRFNIQAS